MNAIQSLIGTISAAPGRIGRPAIFALSALCACAGTEEVAQPLGGCPPEYQGVAGNPEDLVAEIPPSCAFECTTDCPEPETPYDCPALRAWSSFPHAKECGCFDALPPAVTPGTCTASKPGGAALRAAGPQGNGAWVLPDGHLIKPAGVYAPLGEKGLEGTFPMSLLRVPGTSLLLSSDGGILDNALRLLDAEALAAGTPPTAAFVPFAAPRSLFHGLAWRAPATALASGGGDGFVYAFTVDMEKRSVKRDAGLDIDLGGPTGSSYGPARWYSGPLAVSGDGARLLVGPSVSAGHIQMLSLEEESWGEMRGKIAVDAESVFEIALDPFDKQGVTFYATLWDAAELVEIDADAKEVTRTLEVGKNPEGLAFLGPELMVVASADEDRLTVIDRTSWQEKARLELAGEGPLYGHGPTWLAFDAARARLYATLSGVNAVAAFDVAGAGADATIVPAGRIPTAWWPTALSVQDDGSLVVLAGKGTGSGADSGTYSWSEGPITELMHGGVQYVPAWSLLDLAGMTELAEGARQLARTPGYPEVSCAGESYDFPVPRSPADGPSERIKHVLFVVRENKTYDTVFGDLPGTNGDPQLVLAPGEMDAIWPNSRKLARGFTNFDNFYTDAEQSIQGHVWTAFGRTTDFVERSWLTAWGRGTRPPTVAGVAEQGRPKEGSLFDALERAGVPYANMGELVGVGQQPLDPHYPGLVTTIGWPDVEKACYLAALARAQCALPPLAYVVLPNDHTLGGAAMTAHPGVMIAVNDEATGMLVDALSHSPLWKDSLVIVTEDDPQNGADHVDVHRTLLFVASPWVKRGYVSHGHYDTASVHKLILAILGVPYPNEQIAQAPMPFDAFSATPDYAPYEHVPRAYDQPCNPAESKAAEAAQGWNRDAVDEQPGIQYWIWRILHERSYD